MASAYANAQSASVSFASSVVPLLKLLSLTLFGIFLAHPKTQVLPRSAFKLLSKLVFALFLPCLIFVNLGESITLQNVLKWWFIPVNVVLSTVIGCALGYIVAVICRPPPQFFRLTVIMTGFGNSGNLMIAIIGSICDGSNQPFGSGCQQNGVAYISLAQWVAVILVYTLVYHMMEPPIQHYLMNRAGEIEEETTINLSRPLLHEAEWPGMEDKELAHSKTPFIARVFMSLTGSSRSNFPDVDLSDEASTSAGSTSPKSIRCLAEPKVVRRIRTVAEQTPIRHVLQPPTIASLLAIIVGLVPAFRDFMFGEDAPLSFFSDSLQILAEAVVPSVMLVLGGMLAEGPNNSTLGRSTLAGIIVARLLVLPLVGIGLVVLAGKLHLTIEGDRMYKFVLLMQYTTPTSLLLAAIASVRGYAVPEASALLFWQHICALFSLSLYLFIYFKIIPYL